MNRLPRRQTSADLTESGPRRRWRSRCGPEEITSNGTPVASKKVIAYYDCGGRSATARGEAWHCGATSAAFGPSAYWRNEGSEACLVPPHHRLRGLWDSSDSWGQRSDGGAKHHGVLGERVFVVNGRAVGSG
jgi:hypothetical protein